MSEYDGFLRNYDLSDMIILIYACDGGFDMPLEMPVDSRITIQKRNLSPDFAMPQMERAEKHFSLGYIISGDRRVITPYEQYDAHAGDVTAMPPQMYHRTFSLSNRPYINYLLKIAPDVADDFCREIDKEIWNYICEQKRFSFDKETSAKIEMILSDMLEIYEQDEPYAKRLLQGLLFRLLVMIREKNIAEGNNQFKGILSHEMMEAMYYLEKNFAENIKLSDAARQIGFSEGHFSRLFSSQVGTSFSNYLINIRLRHAKELLINTDLSVSEIAMRTGFGSGDYLSASFSKYEGVAPIAFRKKLREATR